MSGQIQNPRDPSRCLRRFYCYVEPVKTSDGARAVTGLLELLDLGVLVCPDDASPLGGSAEGLECRECGRSFPVFGDRVLELLPSRTQPGASANESYAQSYLESRE